MSQSNDLNLSLSGKAFAPLRSDFDEVLRSTLRGMIDTEQNVAEITTKVKIILADGSAPDYSVAGGYHTREITKPKFEHTITAVVQRKEKKTGSFAGEYELVFDKDTGAYVARPIENEQTTMFDEKESASKGEVIDADYTVISGQNEVPALGSGPMALPEARRELAEQGDGEVQEDAEEVAPGDAGEFEEPEIDPAHDPRKPFGWLRQFVGEKLRVTEAMGNYTVRTGDNKVVLSSATSPENPFYCAKEMLESHIGHKITCVGYGKDELVSISIECESCGAVLFSVYTPEEEPVGPETDGEDDPEASASGSEQDEEDEDAGGYEYEPPDEQG